MCTFCLQVDKICEFPSHYFYEGKLKTAKKSKWFDHEDHCLTIWPSSGFPMVFCHVEGTEVSQAVSTPEGNEQSKSNEEERRHVVRILSQSNVVLSVVWCCQLRTVTLAC